MKENCWKIKRETEGFRQKTGREPSLEELSVITELSREEIAMALESSAEVESIYKTIPQKDGSEICLLDRMESQNQGGGMQQLLNRVVLEQLLTELPDMERRLIIMRYMQDKTQSEVARVLGVSQVQVSRLEKRILKQMRAMGIEVVSLPDVQGRVDLLQLMNYLGSQKIDSVFLEGGGELNDSFLRAGLVQELKVFIAPKIFGGKEAKTPVSGVGVELPDQGTAFVLEKTSVIGEDFLLEYRTE